MQCVRQLERACPIESGETFVLLDLVNNLDPDYMDGRYTHVVGGGEEHDKLAGGRPVGSPAKVMTLYARLEEAKNIILLAFKRCLKLVLNWYIW